MSPVKLSPWLASMRQWIFSSEPSAGYAKYLLTSYTVQVKDGKMAVASAEQAKTCEERAMLLEQLEAPIQGEVPAASAHTGATSIYGWSTPHPVVARTLTKLSEDLERAYTLSPQLLAQRREQLCEQILLGIPSGPACDDYRTASGCCALRLLHILHAEAATIGITETTSIQDDMASFFTTGLTSTSNGAFNTFRNTYETLNNSLPPNDEKVSPQRLVQRYTQLIDKRWT